MIPKSTATDTLMGFYARHSSHLGIKPINIPQLDLKALTVNATLRGVERTRALMAGPPEFVTERMLNNMLGGFEGCWF